MRRRRAVLLVPLLLLAVVVGAPAADAGDGPCPGQVQVRGVVRDAATGLRLQEVTSVGVIQVDGDYEDGEGTNANSFWYDCVDPGTYTFGFSADSYRVEWYDDQPNQASATEVEVAAPGPVVINVALTPRGRVIAGRVTNMRGVPQFASIGIYRQARNGRWVSIDGEGNHMPSGWWSYRVPSYGRYKVNACVDNHWCQWATSADRRSRSRTIVVGASTTFVNNVHVRVPFCRSSPPDFCVPWGFNT